MLINLQFPIKNWFTDILTEQYGLPQEHLIYFKPIETAVVLLYFQSQIAEEILLKKINISFRCEK